MKLEMGRSHPILRTLGRLAKESSALHHGSFRRRRPGGRGTDILPSAEGVHLPLIAGELAVGVLSVRPTDAATIAYAYSQQDLLEGFAREIALAIDRHRLRDAKQRAKMDQESEV